MFRVRQNVVENKKKFPLVNCFRQKFIFSGQQMILYISCHLHLFMNSDTGRMIIIEISPLHVFSSATGTDL